ncbi:Uncharacterised protein [Bordetella pertussis]|nr:Uncharacterised protein [Bordetella pertussis]CFO00485.1 Uncharacterised protein [Bordetella pertussis]CFO95681.1 Uncharacterised protein [Bordetella pertussis]CFU02469.1 Uncharacterised protein [Bordetella pertussis]CFW07403.1 Uncharacterised protein [Bordetella pertussis]
MLDGKYCDSEAICWRTPSAVASALASGESTMANAAVGLPFRRAPNW